MTPDLPAQSPAGPPAGLSAVAARLFGARLPVAEEYGRLLATVGTERGLLGPREADRLWDRHLLNCAVVADILGDVDHVVDVGSGAGLPGIVLALVRPGLRVTLVEPLARRVTFLDEIVAHLGLDDVEVVRGRAEDLAGRVSAPVVTARAVAPLDRLARWCLPLCARGGRLLALKGASAAEEIREHADAVARVGGGVARIVECGTGVLDPPTTVVEVPLLDPRRAAPRRPPADRSPGGRARTGPLPSPDRRRRGQRDP